MNYGKIIKDAWMVIRKNQKLVWLAGIPYIVGLLNFNYSSLSLFFPKMTVPEIFSTNFILEIRKIFLSIVTGMEYSLNLDVFIPAMFFYLLTFGCSVFSLAAVLYGLRMVRQGESPTYAAIFEHVTQHYKTFLLWSIFSLLLTGLFSLFMLLVNVFPSLILSCLFMWLSYPLEIIVIFFVSFVPVLIAFEDRTIPSAIQSTWTDFLKPHFWKVVLMELIFGILCFVIIIGFLLICVPLLLILYFLGSDGVTSFSTLFVLLLTYSPIIVAGSGFFSVFTYGIWIGFYDQIKAIDRTKEAAAEFSGAVEVDVEEPSGDNE